LISPQFGHFVNSALNNCPHFSHLTNFMLHGLQKTGSRQPEFNSVSQNGHLHSFFIFSLSPPDSNKAGASLRRELEPVLFL